MSRSRSAVALVACLTVAPAGALAAASPTAPVSPTSETARAEARELFVRAIAFRTVAGEGQVPLFAEELARRLRAAGFAADDVRVLPLGETASLVARYRGDGSGGRPILLVAHMDVVEARAADWTRDPFTLAEEDGFFFGRGTADIKGDLVAIVSTLVRWKRAGVVPRRDLILALTGDEESGQATTRDLAGPHRELVDAELALNGDGGGGILAEATGAASHYYLQGAEKSYATYELVARNPGGHSSEPRADNAIYDLAEALRALAAYEFPVRTNEWTLGSLRASAAVTPGELGDAMRRFAADPDDAAAAAVLARDPSYVGRIRTTCVATMLEGGHAENALPQSAVAKVNCRIFPGTTGDEVRDALAAIAGAKIEVRATQRSLTAAASPLRDDVVAAVTAAVRASYPGTPLVPDQAAYYTDGSILRAAGIPTYGVSGMFLKNSDSFAHGLNERLPVAAFYRGLVHWDVLLRELAGPR